MKRKPKFPLTLLDAPIEERLAYFTNYPFIRHPILEYLTNELLRAIRQPCGYSLIHVYGPTGVGKTTLQQLVTKALIEDFLAEEEQDPGKIPVVSMEVPAPGTYRWKDVLRRILLKADEPLIDYKVNLNLRMQRNAAGKLIIRGRATEADLRFAVEHCLKHRRLQALILDEAHHFGKVPPSQMQDQMDVLKSLANSSETLLVLLGTYELLDLTSLSGQLSRRTLSLHFRRYGTSEEDKKSFASTINSFEYMMPLKEMPSLVKEMDFLYLGSMGCIGILKQWLDRALWNALQRGAVTVTRDHLEATRIPQRERLRIAEEIRYGEEILVETEDMESKLRHLLGMSRSTNERSQTNNGRKRRQKPGVRNPHRDPVGDDEDEDPSIL